MATFTLSQYSTWIKARLDDTDYSGSNLTQFINDTNRYICNMERWSFMEAIQEDSISAGSNSFEFEDDVQAPISLRNTTANYVGQLPFLPFETFDANYPDPSSQTETTPVAWTTFAREVIVGPAPVDQAYTFKLKYLKNPTVLSASTDIVDIPDEFSEALVLGALARALMANDNYDQAQFIQQEFDLQIRMMGERLLPSALTAPITMGNGRL